MTKPSKELEDIWKNSAWVVKEIVQKLDGLIVKMIDDAVIHGIKRTAAIKYFAKKLLEVIHEVAEERETETQQIKRQEKQIREYRKSKSTFWRN